MPGFTRWQSKNSIAIYVPTGQKYPSGEPIRHYETIRRLPGETDKELEARANARKAELELAYYHGDRTAVAKKFTVRDMFNWWFAEPVAEKLAAGRLEQSTVEGYRNIVDLHILPRHGDLRLADLCESDIESLYDHLRAAGMSEIRLLAVHKVYRAALNAAKRKRLIRANPIDFLDETAVPEPEEPEHRTFTLDEARRFIEAASDDLKELALVFSLLAGTRIGETLGIRLEDIDYQAGAIHIRQAVKRAGRTPMIGDPKSRHGRRNIPLTDLLKEIIRRALAKRERLRQKVGPRYHDSGLLFTNRWGGPLDRRNLGRKERAFGRLLTRAELPWIRVHDLRHSFATLAKELGADSKHLSDAVGHADPSLIDTRYAHRSMPAQRAIYNRLHGRLAKKRTK